MSIECSASRRGSVCGVGIYEAGRHAATDSVGQTKLYSLWASMLQRCYLPSVQKRCTSYVGCSVDKRFHHFQDFCDWSVAQVGFPESYHLDKDLLVVGNKVYGPETCVFVPNIINNLTLQCKKNRGTYPIGVSYHKTNGTFTAKVVVGWAKRAKAGFAHPEQAFLWYKCEKERIIKSLAAEYKSSIDSRVYVRLMTWEIQVDD